jgi:hypothetical protein
MRSSDLYLSHCFQYGVSNALRVYVSVLRVMLGMKMEHRVISTCITKHFLSVGVLQRGIVAGVVQSIKSILELFTLLVVQTDYIRSLVF